MHKIFMRDAIDEAKLALAAGEVPVGGLLLCGRGGGLWEGGAATAAKSGMIPLPMRRCWRFARQRSDWAGGA